MRFDLKRFKQISKQQHYVCELKTANGVNAFQIVSVVFVALSMNE